MTRLRGVKSTSSNLLEGHCTGAEIEVSAMRVSDWCGILASLALTPHRWGSKWTVVRQEVGSRR